MFQKLDMFLSSGEGWETPTLLGLYPYLRTEIDPVFQNVIFSSLIYLEFPMIDKVQKPSDSEQVRVWKTYK
jgi:hypothetical protein